MLETPADPTDISSLAASETDADVSDYFIGAPGSFVQCSIQLLDNRTRYGGLFGQDSWKATPSLTINYGLRWDVARPWSDVYGRLTTPVPGAQSVKFPNSPLGNLVPGDPGVPSTISPTRWSNFGPRFGIAYAPSGGLWGAAGKTSIRAAYGIYYLGVADNGNFGILGDAPWGLYWASPQPTEFAKPLHHSRNRSHPGTALPLYLPSRAPDRFRTSSSATSCLSTCRATTTTTRPMGAQHFNFSVQRQLDKSTVLTVAYVGTLGHHIEHGVTHPLGECLALPVACRVAGRAAKAGVYQQNGQNIYGTLVGAIDNQTISPNYTQLQWRSGGGLRPGDSTCRTRETLTTTHCRFRRNVALATSPSCSPIPTPNRWIRTLPRYDPRTPAS